MLTVCGLSNGNDMLMFELKKKCLFLRAKFGLISCCSWCGSWVSVFVFMSVLHAHQHLTLPAVLPSMTTWVWKFAGKHERRVKGLWPFQHAGAVYESALFYWRCTLEQVTSCLQHPGRPIFYWEGKVLECMNGRQRSRKQESCDSHVSCAGLENAPCLLIYN